jgi:hypothetical protein
MLTWISIHLFAPQPVAIVVSCTFLTATHSSGWELLSASVNSWNEAQEAVDWHDKGQLQQLSGSCLRFLDPAPVRLNSSVCHWLPILPAHAAVVVAQSLALWLKTQ